MKVIASRILWLATIVVAGGVAPMEAADCTGGSLSTRVGVESSLLCLSCHDGSMASRVLPREQGFAEIGIQGDHPVMISYQESYQRSPEAFVAPAMVDSRIKFENGKMECVSCHATPATDQQLLVMPNERGQLCLSCHRM